MHRGNIMAYKSKAYWLPMPCIALYCFETAKLFKPIGVPISCHPIQLVQPWSQSGKPLKFSTKRRSQCSSHIASFWTMKVRSISKWDQHPSQLFAFSMVGSQRGMPVCHSWSHWGNSLKPEIKKVHCEDPGDGNNNLFDQQEADPPAKKRRTAAPSPCVVTITVGDKLVDCLVSGKRPARSDLAVLLEPDHLDPVICHLRPGTTSFGAAHPIPQDQEVRQVVAYQLREMEEKSCSQTLYGYPYSQFAASIGEALSLPFMSQSQANGSPWPMARNMCVFFVPHMPHGSF